MLTTPISDKMDLKVYRYKDFEEIFSSLKTSRFKKVLPSTLKEEVMFRFVIDEKYSSLVENSVKNFLKKRSAVHHSVGPSNELENSVILMLDDSTVKDFEDWSESDDDCQDTPNYYSSLIAVSSRQQYRTQKVISYLEEEADLNKVTVNQLIGIVTKQINYKKERAAAKVGELLLKNEVIPRMTEEKSSYLQLNLNLGRFNY